jgi:hypothetical protein
MSAALLLLDGSSSERALADNGVDCAADRQNVARPQDRGLDRAAIDVHSIG